MKKYAILSLFALWFGASCTNEIVYDYEDNPTLLVMNALITPDSLTHVLYLNLTGRNRPAHVEGATVEVRVNGQLKETLRPLSADGSSQGQCAFRIMSDFAGGDLVRIDARTDDGAHHAWAELVVPAALPRIDAVDTLTVPLKRHGTVSDHMRYRITITDRPNEKNYYRLLVDRQSVWEHWDSQYDKRSREVSLESDFIYREDVVLTDGKPYNDDTDEFGMFEEVRNSYTVFDDSRFENSTHTLTVYNRLDWQRDEYAPYPFNTQTREVVIRVLSITEDMFRYLKMLNVLRSEAYDEVLSEPIKFPSNVQGGTGFVGICSQAEYRILLFRHEY